MEGLKLTPGVYDSLEVVSTQALDGKVEGEPIIEIRLEEPTTHDWIFHRLWTSNAAWDAVTLDTLKSGYGIDPASFDYALISFFNDPNNALIGKSVGPVVLKEETYLNQNGETKTTTKVARVGAFIPKGLIDAGDYAAKDAALKARLSAGRKPKLVAAPKPMPAPAPQAVPVAADGTPF